LNFSRNKEGNALLSTWKHKVSLLEFANSTKNQEKMEKSIRSAMKKDEKRDSKTGLSA